MTAGMRMGCIWSVWTCLQDTEIGMARHCLGLDWQNIATGQYYQLLVTIMWSVPCLLPQLHVSTTSLCLLTSHLAL